MFKAIYKGRLGGAYSSLTKPKRPDIEVVQLATLKYKSGDSWIDILHPIGSFYFSNSDESPSVLFGGTWTQITGAAIRGDISTGYTGNDTCTLTVDEIPAHRHGIQQTYNVGSGVGSTVPAWNSHYFNTQYTDYSGGGAAHSIVQRSYNCYIWYRTAQVYYNI